MLKTRLPWTLLYIAALFAPLANASDLIGSGERLRMMQKIQGQWSNRCEPFTRVPKELFGATHIDISYTHLTVSKHIFKDSRCLHTADIRKAKYRYVLGEPVRTAQGKFAFELNLQAESDEGASLNPLNIILYEKGALYLGLWQDSEVGERLQKLDVDNPYKR